jgi:hypothetical protein
MLGDALGGRLRFGLGPFERIREFCDVAAPLNARELLLCLLGCRVQDSFATMRGPSRAASGTGSLFQAPMNSR